MITQQVKNLHAMHEPQETQVQSLGWEDPLQRETGKPLQYSCLENPMDREAWWAIVMGWQSDATEQVTHEHSFK